MSGALCYRFRSNHLIGNCCKLGYFYEFFIQNQVVSLAWSRVVETIRFWWFCY